MKAKDYEYAVKLAEIARANYENGYAQGYVEGLKEALKIVEKGKDE